AAVVVGEAGRLVRRLRQVVPAQPAEEALEEPLPQQVARGGPVLLAGEGQFVEGAALAARREDERTAERPGADGDRAAVARVPRQLGAVVVAVGGAVRVDPGALGAGLAHAVQWLV